MSGQGAVWIAPEYFFATVAALRKRAELPDDLSALSVPDVAHAGGTSYLEALVNSVDEARAMLSANLEIAGRALLVAGTRVVDADMAEQDSDPWDMAGGAPYNIVDGPAEGQDYDDWEDDQQQYYDDFYEYVDGTEGLEGW